MDAGLESGSAVDRVYQEVKTLLTTYAIKPGTRLNEGEIARSLGVSRTPLREALNQLKAAGFLDYAPKQGFFGKQPNPGEIFDLYEMRFAIEVAAVRLAAARASAKALDEIEQFLAVSARGTAQLGVDQLVKFDEGFHERIVALAGNRQLLDCLLNINDRIRYFRWIDMEGEKRRNTQDEHRQVLQALRARDGERAAKIMESHVVRRRDQIMSQVREGYTRIYVGHHNSYAEASQEI